MFVKKSAPGHHLPPVVYFRGTQLHLHHLASMHLVQQILLSIYYVSVNQHWGAKQGEKRLLTLQDLEFSLRK